MDFYAVVGSPIGHSLSPRIHAAFAAQTGQVMRYEARELAPDGFAEGLAALAAEGLCGGNVTLPFKTDALKSCAEASERARRAGAVNTLLRRDGGWYGDNTDGIGLLRDLERLGLSPRNKRVLLLGAGGAARGVIEPLLTAGPAELVVSNRNPWKPEALAESFAALGPIRPCTHIALKGDAFDLIVNATSAGHEGRMPRLPDGLAAPGCVAYDLSYGKAHAPFQAWALAAGMAVHDGLGMLVEQAAEAFALFRGVRPETAPVLTELRAG